MVKLDLYRGWFRPAELPDGERYMELLTAPEEPRQRPKVEVSALIGFTENGKKKTGLFAGVWSDGTVLIADIILTWEERGRQTLEIGRFVRRPLGEVRLLALL